MTTLPFSGSGAFVDKGELQPLIRRFMSTVEVRDCIAWVGAGLSQPCYPLWGDLVRDLCEVCKVERITQQEKETTNPEDLPDLLMARAQACKHRDPDAYEEHLGRTFGELTTQTRLAYSFLMEVPFRAYVTTNFDPMLKHAARAAGGRVVYYPELLAGDVFLGHAKAYYLHGCALPDATPTGKGLLLATNDFGEGYRRCMEQFISPVFMKAPILFVGYRLGEAGIRRIVSMAVWVQKYIEEGSGKTDWPHRFALLDMPRKRGGKEKEPAVSEWDQKEADAILAHFAELSIDVLFYRPRPGGDHVEVEGFLDMLREACMPLAPMAEPQGGPHDGP